jgi:type II secretory pathway pseudopilin PulG
MHPLPPSPARQVPAPHWNGFTLVELCAVMAAMVLLGTVLLPALAGTRTGTEAFQCMNNERQIILGWQMYAADNQGVLAQNDFPYLTAYRGQTPATQAEMRNWVVGTMASSLDANSASPGAVAELTDPNTLLSP